MPKFDVYVDCSATITLAVEANSQKEANDSVADAIIANAWYCEDHRDEFEFFDPCVYRDNEEE